MLAKLSAVRATSAATMSAINEPKIHGSSRCGFDVLRLAGDHPRTGVRPREGTGSC